MVRWAGCFATYARGHQDRCVYPTETLLVRRSVLLLNSTVGQLFHEVHLDVCVRMVINGDDDTDRIKLRDCV